MLICSRMSLEHTTENMASLTGPLIKCYLRKKKKQRRACPSPDLNLAQHVNLDSCNLDCTFRRSNAASGSEYWNVLHTLLCSKFRLQKDRVGRCGCRWPQRPLPSSDCMRRQRSPLIYMSVPGLQRSRCSIWGPHF